MKYYMPPGIKVEQIFNQIIICFHNEQQAEQFVNFLKFMDQAPSGQEMTINRPEEHHA